MKRRRIERAKIRLFTTAKYTLEFRIPDHSKASHRNWHPLCSSDSLEELKSRMKNGSTCHEYRVIENRVIENSNA